MKVFLDTVGCRLNQSEIETYARQLTTAGHQLVASMEEADLMILNSCTVTAAAATDSRQKVRHAHKAGVERIVVTGCLSTIQPDKVNSMRGVIQIVPNEDKDSLVADLLQMELADLENSNTPRQIVPGPRMRTRAFIKVQDGCDNRCTFCITTVARGHSRSRSISTIVRDVRAAIDSGVKEVVLTGVHLGSWGQDFTNPQHLRHLITYLLTYTDLSRLRVSSLEPWDLDAAFFELWQDPRLCRHLHLPLQSGSATVLRRMARNTTPQAYAELIEAARHRIPDVAITTDLIVGFPGESEAEFEETCEYIRQIAFASTHVFTYSARQGTVAARMPDQVHNFTRKERSAILRQISDESAHAYRNKFISTKMPVLWETNTPLDSANQWQLTGLTDNYLKVRALASQPLKNQITIAKLVATTPNDSFISGEITQYTDTMI
jgi:threonylcarbamoyladenosine tRNA methylthiotransferase MtaB